MWQKSRRRENNRGREEGSGSQSRCLNMAGVRGGRNSWLPFPKYSQEWGEKGRT